MTGVSLELLFIFHQELPLLSSNSCMIFGIFSHLSTSSRNHPKPGPWEDNFCNFACLSESSLIQFLLWLTVCPGTRFQIGDYLFPDLEGIVQFLWGYTTAVKKSGTVCFLYLWPTFSSVKICSKKCIFTPYQKPLNSPFFNHHAGHLVFPFWWKFSILFLSAFFLSSF